jgi:hypothetical protein
MEAHPVSNIVVESQGVHGTMNCPVYGMAHVVVDMLPVFPIAIQDLHITLLRIVNVKRQEQDGIRVDGEDHPNNVPSR